MSFGKVPNFLVNLFEAEMTSSGTHSYRFNSFLLDVAERQLFNGDKPVPLTPKAFDVLVYLVENAGHLVRKDELMQAIWPDSFVDEVNLPRTIHTIRAVLGADNGTKFIETVPTKGYRFVAEVSIVGTPASETPALESGKTAVRSLPAAALLVDEAVPPTQPKQQTRIILFTVGFACAISLIFLLSFNFQPASAVRSNDVKLNSQKQYTTNDEAYRLYLLGSALADKLNRDDAAKAIDAYEKAIKLEPNYAPAYAGLANVHTAFAFMGGAGNATEQYLKAKTAVEKALEIDPDLAEAHSYLGEMKTNFEWDFAGAEREHKRAIELNPNSAAAHRMYALLLSFLERPDESIAEIKTAIDLEPGSVLNHYIYQQALFYARHYDEAIAEGKRTFELDAGFYLIYSTLISSYLMKGEDDLAFESFLRQWEQFNDKPDEIQLWKTVYARSGWRGIRERQLEQARDAEKNGNANPLFLARLYTTTGNIEQAFVYLERAFDARAQGMISLKVSPNYDLLRSDPRFETLVNRIGLK